MGGLREFENENVTQSVTSLAKDIDVDLVETDISTAYRMGPKKNNGKPRVILACFVRRDKKNDVFRNRRKLKTVAVEGGGKKYIGVSVGDDLTKPRQQLLKILKEDNKIEDSWSFGGKIYCKKKDNTNKKYCITSPDDLFLLGWDENKIKGTNLYVKLG